MRGKPHGTGKRQLGAGFASGRIRRIAAGLSPADDQPADCERDRGWVSESDFTVAFSQEPCFKHAHLDVNYGIGRIGTGPDLPRFTQHLVSLSASVEVPGPVTPYAETFWISRQDRDGGPVVAIDSGAIYQISPRYALDGGIQGGLSGAAPSLSVFGGFSAIIRQHPWRPRRSRRQRESARRRAQLNSENRRITITVRSR
jgi:hypothetical protein